MPQPENFAKCACQHCGGHIEFPAQGIGRKIACPHCGGPTFLTRAAPVEIGGGPCARRRIYWSVGVAMCLIAAAGGAYVYVNYSSLKRAAAPVAAAGQLPPPKPKPAPDPWHGLKASAVSLDKPGDGRLIYAVGTLTNETKRQRFGVKVQLDVLDAHHNKLGSATDYTDVIEPGKEWKFRAMITDPHATEAKLTKVKEQ